MTKSDIVKQIADKTGSDKAVTLQIVESLMEEIKNSIVGGEPVCLRGFGSFIIKQRAAKKARNISKGTTVEIPAYKIPSFKPSKEFKAKLK